MDDDTFLNHLHEQDAVVPILTTGTVNGDTPYNICFTNSAGGTETLPKGSYRVGLTRLFHDYETGTRMIGRLLEEEDINTATQLGTITISKERAAELKRSPRPFHPEIVYFNSNCFIPDSPAIPTRAL